MQATDLLERRNLMKTKLLALALLAVFLVGCHQPGWKEFRSSEGAFSILLPGTPTEQISTAGPIDFHFFVLEQKDITYMVGYSDYPDTLVQERTPDVMLDGTRDGAVANVQGELLSELIISLNEYPGRELKIESHGGKVTTKTRIFMVGHRLYQVMVATRKEKAFSENVKRFLDSFKLLEK